MSSEESSVAVRNFEPGTVVLIFAVGGTQRFAAALTSSSSKTSTFKDKDGKLYCLDVSKTRSDTRVLKRECIRSRSCCISSDQSLWGTVLLTLILCAPRIMLHCHAASSRHLQAPWLVEGSTPAAVEEGTVPRGHCSLNINALLFAYHSSLTCRLLACNYKRKVNEFIVQ